MGANNGTAARRRRVDLLDDPADFQCALLASLGFSTRYISQKTGLSACQVTYRLTKGQVRRADYRNGTSDIARSILRRNADIAEPLLRRAIRATLAAS